MSTTSSVKTTARVGARPSTRSTPKIACSTTPPRASTVAATRSIASRARSRLLTLTFAISQLLGPRNWAMVGGSNGYRAALVRRQRTPGLISSSPGTAGLPPFISFSTGYPELDSAVGDPLTDVRADIYLLSGRRRPRPGRRKALTADMTTVQGLEQG